MPSFFVCRCLGLAALLVAFSAASTAQDKAEPKVEVKIVKYDGLTATIKSLKGNIVVVDVWGIT